MKRIIFMAALVLSLSACDNTKVQLRAPEPEGTSVSTEVTTASDSSVNNSIKKDTVISH